MTTGDAGSDDGPRENSSPDGQPPDESVASGADDETQPASGAPETPAPHTGDDTDGTDDAPVGDDDTDGTDDVPVGDDAGRTDADAGTRHGTGASPSEPREPETGPSRSRRDGSSAGGVESESLLERFMTDRDGPLMVVRESLTSVLIVALIGLLLFAASGVWPPMVAVESGSMEPHMERGDLVFITDPGRYAPDTAYRDTGVVPYRTAQESGYRSFGDYGSVVVYDSPQRVGPPVIHRARFWVDEGEDWYDQANPDYVRADSCAELMNCPAPHAGFITKGDANALYDQANGISEPVRPTWITGVGAFRIPYLGWVRLWLTEITPVRQAPALALAEPAPTSPRAVAPPSPATVDTPANTPSVQVERANASVVAPAR